MVVVQAQEANSGRKHAYFARNRAALLQSAQLVLSERGDEATIEDFATAANVAVSTIYKHFENRDALIQTAVITAMDEWETWMQGTIAGVSDPLERLVLPLRLFIKMPKTHPVLAKVALSSPRAVSAVLPRLGAGFEANLHELVSQGQLTMESVDTRFAALSAIIRSAFEVSVACWPASESQAREMLGVGLELVGLSDAQIKHLMSLELPNS